MLKLTCVRCLTEVEQPIELEVEEEFASQGTAPDVETIDREEPEAAAISDYVLDAGEFVRQQVALNVPMAFVCRPGCRGICPTCGRNLNQGSCGCPPQVEDDRWSKLGELLRRNGTTPVRGALTRLGRIGSGITKETTFG